MMHRDELFIDILKNMGYNSSSEYEKKTNDEFLNGSDGKILITCSDGRLEVLAPAEVFNKSLNGYLLKEIEEFRLTGGMGTVKRSNEKLAVIRTNGDDGYGFPWYKYHTDKKGENLYKHYYNLPPYVFENLKNNPSLINEQLLSDFRKDNYFNQIVQF
jgi:hypothetical protein